VAFVVPCELLLLFVPGNTTAIVIVIVLGALLMPAVLAMLAAPALSTFGTHAATRPLTSVSLVAAKVEMTLWSTLAAWLLVGVLLVAALLVSGEIAVVSERLHALAEVAGTGRTAVLLLLVLAALVTSTWKNLVQSLCIGLTGRPWLIKSSVLVAILLATMAFPLLWAIAHYDALQSWVWDCMPWILAALVWLKVSAGAWVAIRLYDRKLLPAHTIVAGAVGWLAAVAAVYGILAWLAASPIFPFYFLGAAAVLFVPLARVAAAPLALASSRTR
jgi:hypothetical protein